MVILQINRIQKKGEEGECCYEFGIYSERKLAKDYDNWTPETIHQRAESLKKIY